MKIKIISKIKELFDTRGLLFHVDRSEDKLKLYINEGHENSVKLVGIEDMRNIENINYKFTSKKIKEYDNEQEQYLLSILLMIKWMIIIS